MLKGFIKHAQAQKPLLGHAWRITTTMVKQTEYPQLPIEHSDKMLNREEFITTGQYWLSNVFPIKRGLFDPRRLFGPVYDFTNNRFQEILKSAGETEKCEVKILNKQCFHKEGGYLIELGTKPSSEHLYETLQEKLKNLKERTPLTLHTVKIYKVHGDPWENDLQIPSPFSVMQVDIFGKSVPLLPPSEQHLYEIFRVYGKISYITIEDRSMKDGKPFQVKIKFRRLSSAVAARVCLHGANYYTLSGLRREMELPFTDSASGEMQVTYQPFEARNFFKSYANKHPRIVAVLVGFLVVVLSYTIIDPIRTFFCWRKLTSNKESGFYQYSFWFLKKLGLGVLLGKQKKTEEIPLPHAEEKIQQYLHRPPDTILYITGANGTGKTALAHKAISEYQTKNRLLLDFEELLKTTEEDDFIRELAQRVGFYPGFRVMEWMGSILDAVTPGAGRATSFTAVGKAQKILSTLTEVIQSVSQSSDEDEPLPLIVIDGFSDTYQAKHSFFLNTMVSALDLWVRCKFARVIFIGDTTFDASGGLSSLLPNAKVEKLILSDLPMEVIYDSIRTQTGTKEMSQDMQDALNTLGGRLSDVRSFLNRIRSGQPPKEAVQAIVECSKEDLKHILFEHRKVSKDYSTTQFWKMISILAQKKQIEYDSALFNVFKGDDKALRSLIQTKLFSMVQDSPEEAEYILAGSPVVQAAFEATFKDTVLCAGMDLAVASAALKSEEANVNALEKELVLLHEAGFTKPDSILNGAVQKRIEYLIQRINLSQDKISTYAATVDEKMQLLKNPPPKVQQKEAA